MGFPMKQLVDWAISTGPAVLGDDETIVNNVQRNSYLLGEFVRGKKTTEILQGGNEIVATLFLRRTSNFQVVDPNDDFTWKLGEKDVVTKTDWAFTVDSTTWTENEVMLQSGATGGSDIVTKYRDIMYSKMQGLWESSIEGWEQLLFRNPAGATMFSKMEGNGGREPYSIPAFVHENSSNSGGFDSNWTSVGSVNLAQHGTRWDNARGTYDPAETSTQSANHLFSGFDDVSVDIGFRPPGIGNRYFEPDNAFAHGNQWAPGMIVVTSKAGLKRVMREHRANNDSLIQAQDAQYGMPTWRGVPILDIDILGEVALYDDGSNGWANEAGADEAGARFYFLQPKYLKMIWHNQKFFTLREPKEPTSKVGVFITPMESWGNFICTKRSAQGILSPVATG